MPTDAVLAGDPVIHFAAVAVAALLLGHAGFTKLRQRRWFAAVLAAWRVMPAGLVGPATVAIGVVECLTALACILPATRAAGLLAGAVLLAAYGAGIAANLLRGRGYIDCGCGGPDGGSPLSWWLVGRNAALAGLLLAGAQPPLARPLGLLDVVAIVAVTLTVLLLQATLAALLANRARFEEWV